MTSYLFTFMQDSIPPANPDETCKSARLSWCPGDKAKISQLWTQSDRRVPRDLLPAGARRSKKDFGKRDEIRMKPAA